VKTHLEADGVEAALLELLDVRRELGEVHLLVFLDFLANRSFVVLFLQFNMYCIRYTTSTPVFVTANIQEQYTFIK